LGTSSNYLNHVSLIAMLAVIALSSGPVAAPAVVQERSTGADRLLACESVFTRASSAASLVKHFGAANVSNDEISIGEGEVVPGTILFAKSPEDRVEILWRDSRGRRLPQTISIHGDKSRWATRGGLTLGQDLRTVQRLNGKTFRLLGFSWDYEGTVASWSGGIFTRSGIQGCLVRARLRPDPGNDAPERTRWLKQVTGDREFPSTHPAMQALNPKVYTVWLDFK
jgi:hypothetical protein